MFFIDIDSKSDLLPLKPVQVLFCCSLTGAWRISKHTHTHTLILCDRCGSIGKEGQINIFLIIQVRIVLCGFSAVALLRLHYGMLTCSINMMPTCSINLKVDLFPGLLLW